MKLLLRFVAIAVSLYLAAYFVPGIRVRNNDWTIYAAMALILGIINLLVRPILRFFAFPLTILTLGLFLLVINALTFWLASYLAVTYFAVGFYVDDFVAAFLGALIVSIVSMVLSGLLKEKKD
jgi:putative membrane protein